MNKGTILVYCCPSIFSLTSPPPPPLPKLNVQYIQTKCVSEGGGRLNCAVDHILQEFYTLFLTRFRTYQNSFTTPNKMTSKDDIKGFVSLKFFHPCCVLCTLFPPVAEICARLSGNFCQYFTTVASGANSLVWVAVCYFTAS
jgi:hypothetical protein